MNKDSQAVSSKNFTKGKNEISVAYGRRDMSSAHQLQMARGREIAAA